MHFFEFCKSFKNYLVAHVQTAASDILGYPYVGISCIRSTLKKCTTSSSILVFVHFKLILESCRTPGVYLEPCQTSMMQKRSVIDIRQGSKYDSAVSFFKYFNSFFVWILEWIYEHFVFLLKTCSYFAYATKIKNIRHFIGSQSTCFTVTMEMPSFHILYDKDPKMLTVKNF